MFITFEGIEGCGKTTQIRLLEKRLNRYSIPLTTTLEPGGTRIGTTIREMLLNSGNKDLHSLTELLLYAADRAQHVEEVIRPSLNCGKWVICDRYFDATVAYQGYARGQNMDLIRILNEIITNGIRPDITFLLDCPVEIGLKRAIDRNNGQEIDWMDRFEREKIDFHRKVREGYLKLATKERTRFVMVDASRSEEEMESSIFRALKPYLNESRENLDSSDE